MFAGPTTWRAYLVRYQCHLRVSAVHSSCNQDLRGKAALLLVWDSQSYILSCFVAVVGWTLPARQAIPHRHQFRSSIKELLRMPYLQENGSPFHYHPDDYTEPWLAKSVVLLHHAAAGNLHRWRAWVPALARHHRVLRFDMRGHGLTPPPPQGTFALLAA